VHACRAVVSTCELAPCAAPVARAAVAVRACAAPQRGEVVAAAAAEQAQRKVAEGKKEARGVLFYKVTVKVRAAVCVRVCVLRRWLAHPAEMASCVRGPTACSAPVCDPARCKEIAPATPAHALPCRTTAPACRTATSPTCWGAC
jgi:hypothetical protein